MSKLDDHFSSDDENSNGLTLQFKNHGRLRDAPKPAFFSGAHRIKEIANSFYSFTYSQTTGSLLNTRLNAMQRSMQSIDSDVVSEAVISRLLTSLTESDKLRSQDRISIPLDGHVRETDEEMLEFLTVPYLDLSPANAPFPATKQCQRSFVSTTPQPKLSIHNNKSRELSQPKSPLLGSRPLTRPPSMLRRASSMIMESSFEQPIKSIRNSAEGIPTPLQPNPTKQNSTQAVFTSVSSYPFNIKTLNDIACLMVGSTSQDAQKRCILDIISPKMRESLAKKLLAAAETPDHIKLSGELVEMCSKLVSLWVEESNGGTLMWVVEEVPCFRLPGDALVASDGIYRVDSDENRNIVLQGDECRWAPQAIGAAIVLDAKSLNITGYNRTALKFMLGLRDSIVGKPFSSLVPQFSEFWPTVKQYCSTPGLVVPEHYFRHLAGIPYRSPSFTAPNPSHHENESIRAIVVNTSSSHRHVTYVDIQLRVVDLDIIVVWLSYSNTAALSTVNLLPKIFSVMSATPPQTPKLVPFHTPRSIESKSPSPSPSPSSLLDKKQEVYNELMDVEVGEKRRSLQFSSFEVLKLLGRGAYGEVRLVRTPSKRHTVVLKSIFKDRILVDTWSRDRALGTIPNEIKILNQLRTSNHPHIVEMIDFFEDTKCYHVEMLPVGNPPVMDLFDFVESQDETTSQQHLLNIWKQIASAVAHLHSIGVTHRDLKDENIIMDRHGNTKLIDFGSAAYLNQGPFDVFVGTVDYAAPEIVQGELYEGRPQDAWALGILLYIIMFKEPPFNGGDEILRAALPDELSCLGDSLIRKLLSKNPEDRPTVAESLELAKVVE